MSGNKREQRDRECGLTFSWRSPESSGWSTCAAVILVSLLAAGFLGAIRVRIMPPPRIIERHAGIVVVPETSDGQAWAVSIDEQGPFPSKFDVSHDPSLMAIERGLARQQGQRASYRPKLHDFPVESSLPAVPVSLRGERVFPTDTVAPGSAAPAPVKPLGPTLLPLATLPAAAWPTEFPAYEEQIPPVVAAKTWRFMLEIGPNGRVIQSQPLESSEDAVTAAAIRSIGDWLDQVKLGSAVKPGWIGVEVAFTRNR